MKYRGPWNKYVYVKAVYAKYRGPLNKKTMGINIKVSNAGLRSMETDTGYRHDMPRMSQQNKFLKGGKHRHGEYECS